MSNKTIPLRRVRRRRETKRRMDQILNTLLMLGQVAERYRKHLVTTHYPSGGFFTKREDFSPEEEIGWTQADSKNYRQLIEDAIRESSEATPGLIIPDPVWKGYTFLDHDGNTLLFKNWEEKPIPPTHLFRERWHGIYNPVLYGFDLNEAVEQKLRNAENLNP